MLATEVQRHRVLCGGTYLGKGYKHKFEVRRYKPEYNLQNMCTMFPSIFIHIVDAHIVSRYYHLINVESTAHN